jgi:hypothetical protein
MADGPGKIMAQREVAQAQGAMHLGRTMHAGSLTQASYASTMAPSPGRTHTTSPLPTAMGMETDASCAVSPGRGA